MRSDKTSTVITAAERQRLTDQADQVASAVHAVNGALTRHGKPSGRQLPDLVITAEDLAKAVERALHSASRRRR